MPGRGQQLKAGWVGVVSVGSFCCCSSEDRFCLGKVSEIGAQTAWFAYCQLSFPQEPMRRSTTLKNSSSAMRKMGETLMRRELSPSELGHQRREGACFSVT